VGLGNFPSYRTFYTNLFINEAHNDYSQLLVETGLFGFALMLWFLVPPPLGNLTPLGI
jgi:O-antigen ligase